MGRSSCSQSLRLYLDYRTRKRRGSDSGSSLFLTLLRGHVQVAQDGKNKGYGVGPANEEKVPGTNLAIADADSSFVLVLFSPKGIADDPDSSFPSSFPSFPSSLSSLKLILGPKTRRTPATPLPAARPVGQLARPGSPRLPSASSTLDVVRRAAALTRAVVSLSHAGRACAVEERVLVDLGRLRRRFDASFRE